MFYRSGCKATSWVCRRVPQLARCLLLSKQLEMGWRVSPLNCRSACNTSLDNRFIMFERACNNQYAQQWSVYEDHGSDTLWHSSLEVPSIWLPDCSLMFWIDQSLAEVWSRSQSLWGGYVLYKYYWWLLGNSLVCMCDVCSTQLGRSSSYVQNLKLKNCSTNLRRKPLGCWHQQGWRSQEFYLCYRSTQKVKGCGG